MMGKVLPVEVRGWCELSECEYGAVPRDCIRLGTINICKPCLIILGDGVPRTELDTAEERITTLENELDEALSG